ncbi:MAG TPA: MFS transporter [Planctomycetota bacterium]|nr:MFS transporter [Planctomycetota bacterium]
MIGLFREAPVAPRIADPAVAAERYAKYRKQVLVASLVGYGLFYFCRNNYSVAIPLIADDKPLEISLEQLGIVRGNFLVMYGAWKLLTGLVADRSSPRRLMVAGLVASALLNVGFGLSGSIAAFMALWLLNGIFQSFGAPASAKTLAVWFGAAERGSKTGIWNISHQGGGALVLAFAGLCGKYFGWRGAMIVPALVALVGAIIIAPFLYDRPESEGLPPIDEWKSEPPPPISEATILRQVFLNPRCWVIALASACTYCVRYGALDWTPAYLKHVRGLDPLQSGMSASLLELLGIPGALLCGWLSDRWSARRAPVVFVSLVLLAASTWGLFRVPAGHAGLDLLLLAAIGFFTYGPQMLLAGVAPVDMSDRRVAAAAVGFTGLASYLGAAVSSWGTGHLLPKGHENWQGAFDFWALAAIAGALLCLPLWRATPVAKH